MIFLTSMSSRLGIPEVAPSGFLKRDIPLCIHKIAITQPVFFYMSERRLVRTPPSIIHPSAVISWPTELVWHVPDFFWVTDRSSRITDIPSNKY